MSSNIRTIQQALHRAGFNPGAIDGIWGPQSQAALDAALSAATGNKGVDMFPEVRKAIDEALAILPANMGGDAAVVMLLAIGLQESGLKHRRQIGGPARGLWQFEDGRLSGLAGLFTLPSTAKHMRSLTDARGVAFDRTEVYNRLENDDVLAAGVARLLLWSDPKSLPAVGDISGALDLYLRVWRPGKPHPAAWPDNYRQAVEAVRS